ncbi:MAG: Polysaccharide biosynthesis protein WlaX [uncultured Campylobacterales bacterium]|uniref:Polysaccharide biosynthesis protein WlaX n=1 Tax=uncultured Campylobacterales bacterium TaxID=352960 RepID=A0A6S6S0Z4_9BACT|nr:MAG: Polysaccharide biosynthesis protein WlaX [uncultured Campylobacterales bacterium]
MICIFDCETIPDADLARKIFDIDGTDEEVSNKAFEIQLEKTKSSSFLPVVFHKSVAISAVICDDYGRFQKVSSIDGEDEETILRNFLNFIDKHNPKLISYNGRGFDLPMLMLRAMKYGLSCPAYFNADDRTLGKTKWDNYKARYSDKFHIDLLEMVSDYGAVRGLNLDTLSLMLGHPGKFDVHGDQVVELYYEDKLKEIKEYCESDVLNTYLLYLKYEILRGNISKDDYTEYTAIMNEFIPQSKSYAKVFKENI